MLKNALAFAGIRDIDDGIRWSKCLSGESPTPSLWQVWRSGSLRLVAGGWLQVNENRKLAGRSSLTLVETDIDGRLKQLKQAGIEPRLVSRGEKVSVVMISDPDGNQIVFAQGKDRDHLSTM